MSAQRTFRRFVHKEANFRICSDRFDAVAAEIVRQREILDRYIAGREEFHHSLAPVDPDDTAPDVAGRMIRAAAAVGVGPMAAVAGTMAQLAAEAAGAGEVIVENGGDMYLICDRSVTVGLFAGRSPLADRLALCIEGDRTPLAICSSSSRMGHSASLGDCDLATVVATDAAIADAAATQAANLVRTTADIDPTLERIAAIDGVEGVLLIKADRVGLAGDLPQLVPNRDPGLQLKITRDAAAEWDF